MTPEEQVSRSGMAVQSAIPMDIPLVVPWAEECVEFKKSVKSKFFRVGLTPWIREPLERGANDAWTRTVTLMKPVQTGGSVIGEVLCLYWITFFSGFLQYNWPTLEKFKSRWASRFSSLLRDCGPVAELMSGAKVNSIGEIDFGKMFLRMQGVFESTYLDSDSVTHQINEEVHDWALGRLDKAQARFVASKLFKRADISNAGVKGDQLDVAHRQGTMQEWLVKCPGCSNPHHAANSVFHHMRTKFEEKRKELGGLTYDADGCRKGDFIYDYNKLRPTIWYQMPCGHRIHNQDLTSRRALSDSGKYSEPTNQNAELSHRSYRYDSVIVHDLDWMELIKAKHKALAERLAGNLEAWIKYTQERECIPYDAEDIPIINTINLREGAKKNRDGLPAPRFRTGVLDRQQGSRAKGEFAHWWLVIRDFKVAWGMFKSKLVWEGMVETDEQAVATLREHGVEMHHCCADSGDDTDHVYQFCMRHGINAIKGGKEKWYVHQNGARRIYSPERPLHEMITGCKPKFEYVDALDGEKMVRVPDDREPEFWLYAKTAIAERLHWLRNEKAIDYETPDDVSDDYKNHHDAETREEKEMPSGERIIVWYQTKRRNDLLVCERYACMMWDRYGAMGEFNMAENMQSIDQSK